LGFKLDIKVLNLLIIVLLCVLYSNRVHSEGCINTDSINSDSSLVNSVVTLKKGMIGNNAIKIYKHLYELGQLPCTTISLEDKYPTLSHAVLAMGTLPNRGYPKEADSLFCLLNKNLKCSTKLPAIGSQRKIIIPSLVYTTTKSVKSVILSEKDDPKTDDGLIKILEREEALDPLAPQEERDAILRNVRVRNGNFDVPIFEQSSQTDQYHRVMYAPVISAETHLSLPEEDLNNLIKYSKDPISSENIEIKLIGTPKTIKSQATVSVSTIT